MHRLPPTRYPEDAAAQDANQQQQRTSRSGGFPGLETQSSTSGSTKYSPVSDINSPSAKSPDVGTGAGAYFPANETTTTTLHREPGGGVHHPAATSAGGITWAASPEHSRPNAFPSLSYGGTGSSTTAGYNAHPGIGQRSHTSASNNNSFSNGGEAQAGANVKRGRSLLRPERSRIDENSRFFNYRQHAAVYEAENQGRVGPSSTGYDNATFSVGVPFGSGQGGISAVGLAPGIDGRPGIRRGKSILAREEGMANDSGLNFLKRGATLVRKKTTGRGGGGGDQSQQELLDSAGSKRKTANKSAKSDVPLSWWMIYCYIVTFFLPGVFLKKLGYNTLDRRRAFREKLGLLSVIAALMASVGFLTFGFTDAVCDNTGSRFRTGTVQGGSMIFHGYDYAMDTFQHPAAAGIETNSNPLYSDWAAGGKDGSFMFQKVNQNCKGIITRGTRSQIPYDERTGDLGWYFPCNIYDQYGTTAVNQTGYGAGQLCHTKSSARNLFDEGRTRNVSGGFVWQGPVYYTWDDIRNSSRNLGVYNGAVLDFSLFRWLDRTQVSYPAIFDQLAAGNDTYEGRDSTMEFLISGNRTIAECMNDIIRVGFVDSKSMGCIIADIVLYISLVFILAVVGIKFALAVIFSWFFGRRMGSFKKETNEERQKRDKEVEAWTNDIFKPAPAKYRPNVGGAGRTNAPGQAKKGYLPTTSRFTAASRPHSSYTPVGGEKRQSTFTGSKGFLASKASPPDTPVKTSRSNISLPSSSHFGSGGALLAHSRNSSFDMVDSHGRPCPFPLDHNVLPQPPMDYQPHHFPLAHTILLVTAYSESVEGLRTTLDSLATTDYPNSHKLILVICDGMVKGSGNDLATPDIVLTMMKDNMTPKEDVEPLSYVAVADGHKQHNMAKVYAGFYDYDDETVEFSKQQRVPMVLVAKCGNPLEAHDAKPGNRGKRDSQVLLMAFLQKVMFDERMTSFEYEFFNSIWRVTGISADNYEHVLMVDADTKVFPDSVTRMVACMVQDVDIMGLCGETKIANKKETWVTMIQVFEYYISHHQTKAFESMWGGVTCLPGCFSMYRIKAPKGPDGYWVPILANPDIVEHYSENVVDTLHKKNLLLLGEDRYLTTLMLKTFPKRKMMFCPQAYCKTVVPDTFRVLLSQRRRWINSTIHNLFELLLVRDLCGTFCFSMQFVVFMELVGTLVLPAAIAFTIYILILTCIPSKPTPTIPLILLACILGLPGILIVVTSRKFVFIGWMVIYLFSLPIWNAVLPAYAYFHMDDFSWGSTRKVEGEGKLGGHGDKEGVFDSHAISMKRWSEWERERRYKAGTRSHESPFESIQRTDSPQYSTNRNSIVSSAETFVSQGGGHHQDPFYRAVSSPGGYSTPSPNLLGGRRVDSVQILELPAPLSATPQTQPYQHIASSTNIYETADPGSLHNYEASPYQSSSSENIHQTNASAGDDYARYARPEGYDSDSGERMPLRSSSPDRFYPAQSIMTNESASQGGRTPSPGPAAALQTSQIEQPQKRTPSLPPAARQRGVSLIDPGPVSNAEGSVRVVQRNRRSSQGRGRQSTLGSPAGPFSPIESNSSSSAGLPPGAAPRK